MPKIDDELIKALGLPLDNCLGVSIKITPADGVIVTASYIPPDGLAEKLAAMNKGDSDAIKITISGTEEATAFGLKEQFKRILEINKP